MQSTPADTRENVAAATSHLNAEPSPPPLMSSEIPEATRIPCIAKMGTRVPAQLQTRRQVHGCLPRAPGSGTNAAIDGDAKRAADGPGPSTIASFAPFGVGFGAAPALRRLVGGAVLEGVAPLLTFVGGAALEELAPPLGFCWVATGLEELAGLLGFCSAAKRPCLPDSGTSGRPATAGWD